MNRKLLLIFLAALLLTGLGFGSAMAATLDVVPHTLSATPPATATWTKAKKYTGSYSVDLKTVNPLDKAAVELTPIGSPVPLGAITSLSFYYRHGTPGPGAGPRMSVLVDDTAGSGSHYLLVTSAATASVGPWLKADPIIGTNIPAQWWYGTCNPDGSGFAPIGGPLSFAGVQAMFPLADVVNVGVYMGQEGGVALNAGRAYVDDIEVNTITYRGAIQDAIDAASDGDNIDVWDGTYTEPSGLALSISGMGLHIRGESEGGVVVEPGASPTNGVNVFTINAGGKHVIIENMTIRHGDYGIRSYSGDVDVLNCTLYNNGWDGAGLPGLPDKTKMNAFYNSTNVTNGGAIRIQNSTASVIADCTVFDNDRGIRYQNGDNGLIKRNYCYNNIQSGIHLAAQPNDSSNGCTNTVVRDNESDGNMDNGLLSNGGKNNDFDNNDVHDNWNAGMQMWFVGENDITNNTITNNNLYSFNGQGLDGDAYGGIVVDHTSGIYAGSTYLCKIRGNDISDTQVGATSPAEKIGIHVKDAFWKNNITIQYNWLANHDVDVLVADEADYTFVNWNDFLSSVTGTGVKNTDSADLDAENNWWGHASGPYDNLGWAGWEADATTCFAPLHMRNSDGQGIGVSDVYVDYCPWLWVEAPYDYKDLAVDFAVWGLWTYDGDGNWYNLNSHDPALMVEYNGDLAVVFADKFAPNGFRIYHDDNSLTWIGGPRPDKMIAVGTELFLVYSEYGLYKYDGTSFQRVGFWVPEDMIAVGTDVMVDFGEGRGLYKYDGTSFHGLGLWHPEAMIALGTDAILDFGEGRGLYKYDGTNFHGLTSWSGWSPEDMIAVGTDVMVDFGEGRGLYKYDGTSFHGLGLWHPEAMIAVGTTAILDYGTFGLYKYDGSFKKLSNDDAKVMAAYNGNLIVGFGLKQLYQSDLSDPLAGSWTATPKPWDRPNNALYYSPDKMIDLD